MWDLRFPSGILFTVYGALLSAIGLISPATTAPLAQYNVNLWGGLLFLIAGVTMLWLAKRAS